MPLRLQIIMGKKKKKALTPSTRKMINPTPLNRDLKAGTYSTSSNSAVEYPKLLQRFTLVLPAPSRENVCMGFAKKGEKFREKIKEKKEEHSTVSRIILTEPVEWDSRTIPRKPLAVQAHCHPEPRAAAF